MKFLRAHFCRLTLVLLVQLPAQDAASPRQSVNLMEHTQNVDVSAPGQSIHTVSQLVIVDVVVSDEDKPVYGLKRDLF